jgi:hypothetical protein
LLAIYLHRAATRTTQKITRPLLSIFCERHTINLSGSNLVEIRYPIARLDPPTLAEHGNSGLLRFGQWQWLACPIADSRNPSLLPCSARPGDLSQPAST